MENPIVKGRRRAEIDGELVVFLIGMRINQPWKIHRWLSIILAMTRMLRELNQNPELGFLNAHTWLGRTTILVQYWRSQEKLEAYAKSKDREHLPAWAEFNRVVGANGDVGIWHETYPVRPGDYETTYVNMPLFGLAKAGSSVAGQVLPPVGSEPK